MREYKVPRMQLRQDLPLPDDFRREFNKWLIEFFGYKEETPIFPANLALTFGGKVIMDPKMIAKILNLGPV